VDAVVFSVSPKLQFHFPNSFWQAPLFAAADESQPPAEKTAEKRKIHPKGSKYFVLCYMTEISGTLSQPLIFTNELSLWLGL